MTQGTRELVVIRTFDAPPAQVFDAFVDPTMLVRWLGPAGTTLAGCAVDARPGGRFRFELAFDGGSVTLAGVYRAVERGELISFSWGIEGAGDDSEVTARLRAWGAGTELRLEHRGLRPDEIEQNEAGWSEFFDRLESALSSRQGRSG